MAADDSTNTTANNTSDSDDINSDESIAVIRQAKLDSFKMTQDPVLKSMVKQRDEVGEAIAIPIGWEQEIRKMQDDMKKHKWTVYGWIIYVLGKLVGLFMSVSAASMGAPFWFNALKSVANIRNSIAGGGSSNSKS